MGGDELVSKRESQNSEGAKSAVGEGESREEEWLTTGNDSMGAATSRGGDALPHWTRLA